MNALRLATSVRHFVSLGLFAAGGCLGVNDHGVCTKSDCGGDGFSIVGTVNVALPEQFDVELCHNTVCDTLHFDRPEPGGHSTRDAQRVLLTVRAVDGDGQRFDATFMSAHGPFVDGDDYRLRVLDSSGTALFDKSFSATYKHVSADDGACDDDDDVVCLSGAATFCFGARPVRGSARLRCRT